MAGAEEPFNIPQVVIDAVRAWGRSHSHVTVGPAGEEVKVPLRPDLTWDHLNGCYFFYYAGMYHGVELDGTVHT